MLFLIILIILLSIYIIKSQNIKAAIKKDIEKIIPDNQHDKPQGEQQYNYNREISRKKPVYEPNQDKQNSQTDINTKDTTTEIKTIFLNIIDALKSDYYKLKNSLKEYLKDISIENDVEDDIKHVEKPVYNVPQYNQQYQHNNNPSQCISRWEKIEDKIMLSSPYVLSDMIALFGTILLYGLIFYLVYFGIYKLIANSHGQYGILYSDYKYMRTYGSTIIAISVKIINIIYRLLTLGGILEVILSGYSYKKNNDVKSRKKLLIAVIVTINIFLGTFAFNHFLFDVTSYYNISL